MHECGIQLVDAGSSRYARPLAAFSAETSHPAKRPNLNLEGESVNGYPFVRVYFREIQEMVFDAHDKAFIFYGGVCRRGIYDNMKTAVEAIFIGKARQYNRRFLQMCSHHLIEPVACTPAAGWGWAEPWPKAA